MGRGQSSSANGNQLLFGSRSASNTSKAFESEQEQLANANRKQAFNVFLTLNPRYAEDLRPEDLKKTTDGFAIINTRFTALLNQQGEFHSLTQPALAWHNGNKSWYKNNLWHRDGGPAVISPDGELWMKQGKPHRTDGPAKDWKDGGKEWFLEGDRHRDDGPAIENPDGSYEYWVLGAQHREDGPATKDSSGRETWYINGELHREDGPAVTNSRGYQGFYKKGKKVEPF